MPFELGKALNGGAEWVCGSAAVFGALRNPVVTALLMAALALVVVHALFRAELKDVGWRRNAKAGFWLLVGVSALVFVHYYALQRHLQTECASQGMRTMLASIHHSAAVGGGYAVLAPGGGGPDGGAPPPRRLPDNVEPLELEDAGLLELEDVVLSSTARAPAEL